MIENKVKVRRLSKALGIIIIIVALYFVIEKIWSNRLWLYYRQVNEQILIVIIIGSIAYALNCFLLSTAWKRLLLWFDQSADNLKHCHAIYARTQIGKYVPGNIFHFAGRHVLGSQLGFEHGPLAGAAVYEVAGLLLSSSFLALLGIVFFGTNQADISALSILSIFLFMLIIIPLLNNIMIKLPKLRSFNYRHKKITEIMKGLIPIYLMYFAFFLITGGILLAVVLTISRVDNMHQAGLVVASLAVSWIAGFITPGASGGIGVREAVMVVLLKNTYGEPASLFIALIFRMITVVGDIVFFLSSFFMPINLSGGKEDNIRPLKHN